MMLTGPFFVSIVPGVIISLSKEERESNVTEIHDHLNNLIEEKNAQGLTQHEATKNAIDEFETPKTLAN